MKLKRWQAWQWLVILAVLGAAAFLRFYRLPELPPYLNFDEAGDGAAGLDVLAGHPQIFWRIGGGKEALFPYILALSIGLLGRIPLALRLPSAIIGLLTVAAAMLLAWQLAAGKEKRHRWLFMLATGAGVAASGWHVHLSRLGLRAVLLPLLSTLAVFFLCRALQTHKNRYFAAAGIFLALSLHSYLAARLLPFILLAFLLLDWIVSRRQKIPSLIGQQRQGWLLLVLVFVLLMLPLLLYFIFNPQDIADRAGAVSLFNPAWNHGDIAGTFLSGLWQTLGTFSGLQGSQNPLFNLPGQPALSIGVALLFWLGVFYSLSRWKERSPLLVLLWWAGMLLPSLLAPEGIPHHLRLAGALVPAYLLAACGFTLVLSGLAKFILMRLGHSGWLLPLGSGVVLLAGLLLGYRCYVDYFEAWAQRPELAMAFDKPAFKLAQQIAQSQDPQELYLLAMDIRGGSEALHYTIDYLDTNKSQYRYVKIDETSLPETLTTAAAGRTSLKVVHWLVDKHAEADEKELLTFLLASQARLAGRKNGDGYRIETWELPGTATGFRFPVIGQANGAVFGDCLKLEAENISLTPYGAAVALRWAPIAKMKTDYKASLRLRDSKGAVVAQKDRYLRHNWHQGTSLWPAETVNEYYLLPKVSSGRYHLELMVYDSGTLQPLWSADSEVVDLGEVTIP